MKKIFLLFFTLISISYNAKADVSLMAILYHNGELTTFESTNALIDAIENAQNGDVITLTAGNFNSCELTKNVSIRGAGMMPGQNPTIINGKMTVLIPDADKGTVNFEGVFFSDSFQIKRADIITFQKCYFNNIVDIEQNKNYTTNKLRMIHCIVTTLLDLININPVSTELVNSYFGSFRCDNGINPSIQNCIFNSTGATGSYTNCILLNCTASSYSTFNNCVSNTYQFGDQPITANNKYLPNLGDFFKEDSIYELRDDLTDTLLGNDGTQVGIYGGSMPFTPELSGLKITKFKVGNKTTADGKLPIEISIEG